MKLATLIDQEADCRKRMAAALEAHTAAESEEDKARHLAEFDQAEAEAKAAAAGIAAEEEKAKQVKARADRLDGYNRTAGEFRREPVQTPNLNTRNPLAGDDRDRIPAQARRHGKLKAFTGPRAAENAYDAGLWMAATQFGHEPSRRLYEERNGRIGATLSTTNNAGAAYFVPDVMDTEIARLVLQYGTFRQYARVRQMTSDTLTTPRLTGALAAFFVAEGQAPGQSEQSYDPVTLVAKNLAVYGKISNQLSEDSLIDLGDEWTNEAAIAFALKEDDCGFNGTGTSAFGGITGVLTKIRDTSAARVQAATGRNTLAALTLADFWAVVGKLPNFPGIMPVWFAHKEVYAATMGPLQTAAGGVTPADIAAGGVPSFLGYPVVQVEVMPKVADFAAAYTGILFGDLRMAAAFGDRRGRTFETDRINDDLLKQLRTLFMSERFDINVHTVANPQDTSKPGPILGLQLAA